MHALSLKYKGSVLPIPPLVLHLIPGYVCCTDMANDRSALQARRGCDRGVGYFQISSAHMH